MIQKHLRGYIIRNKVAKQKELKEYLDNKLDFDDDENVGQGLKLSDLSISPRTNFKMQNLKRNHKRLDVNTISELEYNPAESKLDNSQSILNDFFTKNGGKNNKREDTSNLLYIENTCKNYENEDDRDLNKNQMKMNLQGSPFTRILPEDEISVISSRIETNRKGAHNITLDLLNSTRKNKLKDESLRIVESIKKNRDNKVMIMNKRHKPEFHCKNPIIENEEEYDVKNTASYNFKKYMEANENPNNWRKSLTYLKKSQSEKKMKSIGKHKDSLDVVMKTHTINAQKELLASKKDSKKRPGSAGLKLNKPLDIAKMNASLKLLKKKTGIKSQASSSPGKASSQNNVETGRGPFVMSKICEHNLDASKFKRPNGKASLTKKKEKSMNKTARESGSSSKLLSSPKNTRDLPPESPSSISRMRRVFGSEKTIRQQLQRADSNSAISNHHKTKSRIAPNDISELEDSVFERSAFDDYIKKKFQDMSIKLPNFKSIETILIKKADDERKKLDRMLKEKRISSNSFDRNIKTIEKWTESKRNKIKKEELNFIKILGKLSSDVQNIDKNILENDDSMMQSKSFINTNKFESELFLDNQSNIFDISSSNIMRGGEILNNSHLSLINSAMKNTNKGSRSIHKGRENNMSIDSSR